MNLICATSALAKLHSITVWSDKFDQRVNPPDEQISCEEKCPGYDITTTTSYVMGDTLESCPEEECGYYHRCVPQQ